MNIKREIKVGLFVIVGVLILIMGYNFLKGFNPIKGYNKFYVIYHDVTGLVKSSQVTINGMKVGQVEDISLSDAGDISQIVVTLIVVDNIHLPRGTEALITSQDLLGTKAVELKVKGSSATLLMSGDTLLGVNEESLTTSISKMVSPLKEKSDKVLAALDKILMSMNDLLDSSGTRRLANGINDLSWSIQHVRNITEKLDRLSAEEYDKLKAMLNSAESIIRNLKNNSDVISKSLKNISQITDSIAAADLTRTINNTNRVMKELANTLEKVNKGEGSLGKLVNDSSLYVHLDATSRDLDSLMKDMQNYPGRYFSVSVFGGSKRADKADKKRSDDRKKAKSTQ